MDTLLIVDKAGTYIEHSLDYGLLNIGEGNEYDISLNFESDTSISFLKKDQSCVSKISGTFTKSDGPWGKNLSKQTVLSVDDFTFIYLPNIEIKKSTIKDWDASKFPLNAEDKDYPRRLLNFLLNVIDANQGAILLLEDEKLSTLASKEIELQDQSELFLQRILESKNEEMVVNMSFNTHTLLFKAGLTPLDFCLIQYPVGRREKVVLYLPRTKSMGELPEGIMSTLLSLSAGNLANHLLFKKNDELLKGSNSIEFDFFWGKSEKMIFLKNYIDKICKTNLSVFIQGETGTGKEMLVNYIKQRSGTKKVVSVNCAAIPKDLAESILFGHKKGAFTGATSDQIGKIEEASGGILFLDEIGELDLNIQAKLLRVIQENKLTPIGGKEKNVDFWLISATHRDIEQMISERSFREDLYFRINETQIKVPSLRERTEDIPDLATHFTNDIVRTNNLDKKILNRDILDYLKSKMWKGNIRELKSYIRKLVLLIDSQVIDSSSLKELGLLEGNTKSNAYPDDLQEAKRLFVEAHIEKILKRCKGNKSQAARVMGITTRNLYRLLPEKQDNLDIWN